MNDSPHSEFNELEQQLKAERGRHFLSGFLYPALIADIAFIGAFELAIMTVVPAISTNDVYQSTVSRVHSFTAWSEVILIVLVIVTGVQVGRTRKIENELMKWRTSHNHAIENAKKKEINE